MTTPTPSEVIADEMVHGESARGERIVAWGRGGIWTLLGVALLVNLLPLRAALGQGITIAFGLTVTAFGVASFVYARRLTTSTHRRLYAYATVVADLLFISLIPVFVSIVGGRLTTTAELLGTSPLIPLLIFATASVSLRQDPRATWVATIYVVVFCFSAALYSAARGEPSLLPGVLRVGMSPAMWIVRAGLLGGTGWLLAVAARNARRMVHRTATETAAHSHAMRVFGRFVAPEIRDAVVDGEAIAEIRTVTVLFTDLRDFTSLSESIPPKDLMELLNRHFAVLVPVVHRHGGTVNKFVGDALMATFGAPVPLDGHARAAVSAAVEMLRAMETLNAELGPKGQPTLRMGIGIATGPVVVGSLGDPERAEYAVLGDTVNTAARLEGLNKEMGTQILASQATAESVGQGLALRDVGRARVKGKASEVHVFTVAEPAAVA
jgi:class 3 adenylate cyclase